MVDVADDPVGPCPNCGVGYGCHSADCHADQEAGPVPGLVRVLPCPLCTGLRGAHLPDCPDFPGRPK